MTIPWPALIPMALGLWLLIGAGVFAWLDSPERYAGRLKDWADNEPFTGAAALSMLLWPLFLIQYFNER